MHIVFLIHSFPIEGKNAGGVGTYVANMSQIMAQNGHKVTIITEAEKEEVVEWNGIKIRKINAAKGFSNIGKPMPTYKKVLKNIWRSYWYNHEIKKVNKINPVDIVQSASSYGLAMLRNKKIPYVVRVSEYPDLWLGANQEVFDYDKCLARKRLDNEIQYIALKRADKVVVPSFLMQELLQQKIKKETVVIESPILIHQEDKFLFKEEKFESQKYFFTYGSLVNRKGIHTVIRIIDNLLDKYPDMKYVVAGGNGNIRVDGKQMKFTDYCEQTVIRNKDRVVYLGAISDRERLFSIIQNAYMCILPTRMDNLPNTCLEAMRLGKVVVSTTNERGTSAEQLITDGVNGYLANVDDEESLLQKIGTVMNLSEDKKRKIEEKAVERVKDLTPEKVYEKMMDIYMIKIVEI